MAAPAVNSTDSHQAQPPKSRRPAPPKEHTIDASSKATAAFIRRTLCAHQVLAGNSDEAKGRKAPRPLEELLPPLTSSNEIDLELYGLLAVIVKEFIQTWYGKMTPDHVFVDEIIAVVAHCTRALEQRLRKVDVEALLLDEIPELVEAHITGGQTDDSTIPFPALLPPIHVQGRGRRGSLVTGIAAKRVGLILNLCIADSIPCTFHSISHCASASASCPTRARPSASVPRPTPASGTYARTGRVAAVDDTGAAA